jgi:hypothetical protein
MKRSALFIIILLNVISGNSFSQTFITVSNVQLISNTDPTKKIALGEHLSKAIDAFGQPSAVEDYELELDALHAKLYTFLGNKLYFVDDSLYSYELTQNTISVGFVNNQKFKIGDQLTTTTKRIQIGPDPMQYRIEETYSLVGEPVTKESGHGRNIDYAYSATFDFKVGDIYTDQWVVLFFDSNKKLIYVGTN